MSRIRKAFRNTIESARRDPGYVLLHIGTATGLLGFAMTDPLPLRACSITGSAASIIFNLTRKPIVSMVPVYWSGAFIAVNSYKIYQLLLERRAVDLEEQEEDIYMRHFMRSGMRPRQFKKLMENATIRSFEDGTVLHREGRSPPTTVRLLLNGTVRIMSNREEIFTVDATKPICFLGDTHVLEMADRVADDEEAASVPSFSATAVAQCPEDEKVVVLEWQNDYLVQRLTEKSETARCLRAVLTNSMVQKLVDISHNGALDKYTTLMFACALDGEFNEIEKKVLADYAVHHRIDKAAHEQALRSIGWTPEEFDEGYKQSDMPILPDHLWGRLRNRFKQLVDEEDKQRKARW